MKTIQICFKDSMKWKIHCPSFIMCLCVKCSCISCYMLNICWIKSFLCIFTSESSVLSHWTTLKILMTHPALRGYVSRGVGLCYGCKYLGVLFKSEGSMEWEIGRRTGAVRAVLRITLPHRCDKKISEPEGIALHLLFSPRSLSHLWLWWMAHDWKSDIMDTSNWNPFPQRDGWPLHEE